MAACRCAPRPRAQLRPHRWPRPPPAAGPDWPASSPGWPGSGIAGFAAWLVAPAGTPVTAVGELIINLLPAPLVNFGKEALGFADKPILLAMITIAVLALAGLAGRLEYTRRFAGAAVFAIIAVLGLIGISAQPGVAPTAYVPTIIGLLLGYLILSTLISRLQQLAATRGTGVRPGPTHLPRLDPHRRVRRPR